MKNTLTTLALAAMTLCAKAQKADFQRPDTYNYNRAVELYRSEQYADALEYLGREVNDNEKNGYAFVLIADIYVRYLEFGRALTSVNKAIKLLPKKDEDFMSFAYIRRADIYLELADTAKAYSDYETAIKAFPDCKRLYEERAQLLYLQKRWDESDTDYRKIIDIDPGDVVGHVGLGRNALKREQFEKAIEHFSHVIKIAPNYSSGYLYRGDGYIGLKQYDKAADDIVSSLSIDNDARALHSLDVMADSALNAITAKLRIKAMKEPKNEQWPFYLGFVYEQAKDYRKALEYYLKGMDIEPSDVMADCISECYDNLGAYDMALIYMEKAIAMDPETPRYVRRKADILYNAGRGKEAIEVMDGYVEQYPDAADGYSLRGWFRDHSGDIDGAIDDYSLAIAIDNENASRLMNRGVLLRLKGREEEAKADFEAVIKLDTVPDENSVAMYAFCYLGQKDKAIELMDKMLEKSEDEHYDAACLYSIMGDTAVSLSHLRQALERGYRSFAHIDCDRDLDNVRGTQEFAELIDEFKRKMREETAFIDSAAVYSCEDSVAEVPFTKENGVCKVVCKINDLPLHFIFDTGASTVSISNVEATFMYKNGYIKRDDVVGKQNFVDANGDVSEGTVINLRRIDFGGFVLDNVRASVVRNQVAPLLLGQSVLGRLGKIEIDNGKQMIRISSVK